MAYSETNPTLKDINEATYVKITASSDNTQVKIFMPDGTYEADNEAVGTSRERTQNIASNGGVITIQKLPTDVITCTAGLCEKVDVDGNAID
jgi:hypothetical protein